MDGLLVRPHKHTYTFRFVRRRAFFVIYLLITLRFPDLCLDVVLELVADADEFVVLVLHAFDD